MSLQQGTFEPLPSKEELRQWVEEHRRHNADVTSYLWHVIPMAERFGERAYDIAARALRENGLSVSGSQLRALAAELATAEGRGKYAEERRKHVMLHTTG
jgi:hypothetical protein